MKTKYKYIHFSAYEQKKRQKTRRYACFNTKRRILLGQVVWSTGWRQYVIYFADDVVFSKDCLEDVNHFIQQLMDERSEGGGS